ncbi:MAG: signal peptidase I [Chloroflexi bacterium HGW-Chloroflexi-6]|nr:MAG: signal peptidase I [Chloroflexi bacterium HGW-Chloroflexi-6]
MKNPLRLPALLVDLLLLAGLAAIWIAFAPSKIGGQVAYILVNGISMEPGFHTGDLALIRQAPHYQVGDIVTYRDAEMGAYVIHRVIEILPNGYVLQGDNNSWIDAYQPTDSEIIGKLWIHVPNLGKAFQWLRAPLNMTLALGLLGGVFMTSMFSQPQQTKKTKSKQNGTSNGSVFEMALYGAAVLALAFLALTIFAFSRPLTRTADNIQYQHNGVFFYSAAGVPNIYDTDMVRTGEPIFPQLTCSVNVGFSYSMTSAYLQELSGSHNMIARISDEQSGWQRTIALTPQTAFDGDSYSTASEVDLCRVQALVAEVEDQTGFRPNTYTLTILPHLSVMGKIGGQNMQDTFETALVFKFDKVHFYLASTSSDGTNPMVRSAQGLVSNTASQPNSFKLFNFEFMIAESRLFGLAGLLISVGVLGLIGYSLINLAQRDQDAFIRVKYGSLIMDVYDRGIETLSSAIDVATIDDLAKLANRQNAMILHTLREFRHYYFIQADGTTYRYIAGGMRRSPGAPESSQMPHPEILHGGPS